MLFRRGFLLTFDLNFFCLLQNQTVKTDEDLIAEAVVVVVPEDDLEMTEILEETETGQAEVGIIETLFFIFVWEGRGLMLSLQYFCTFSSYDLSWRSSKRLR